MYFCLSFLMRHQSTSMVFNETEKQERAYLRQVIALLKENIGRTDTSVKEHVDTLAAYKDYLWSNKDLDPHEIRSMRESILNHFASGENAIGKRRRLGKIAEIPYFGRIDFKQRKEGADVCPLYIGIHAFYDFQSKRSLIHDWRAPVASLFYEAEPGEAAYHSPSGKVEGVISLKRQYRIRNGHMEFMIESALAVHDEILQRELSARADDKMKNIVATIQREQNRIIRNEEDEVLIIQGVAGSGKTSIALHRIAYLLYTFAGSLSSQDILIVSPNKVFADYISGVLPELGEEAVPQTGMEQLLSAVLDDRYACQRFSELVTELLGKPAPGLIERIRYKATLDFVAALDRFILHMENTYFKAADVELAPGVAIPAGFIEEQFRRFHRYPMRRRFEAMADYILETAQIRYHIAVTTALRNRLKKEIRKMFAGNNDVQVYKDFFRWAGKPELLKWRKNRTLEYADLAPLAYLHLALEGNAAPGRVKHLLIDEMQDYSPIQYKVLQKLYPCRKTILGDAGQSVNPYGSSTAAMIGQVFITGKVMKLCKSYRSTYEITEFAQGIRMNSELEPVARHGEKPLLLPCEREEDELAAIAGLIAAFRRSGHASLGIVCKTEGQAGEMAGRLQACGEKVAFLSGRSSAFSGGVTVTSAQMAKGLEFDEVIVTQVNRENYDSEIDRSMLYVAVTRAMHRLSLTYCGKPSRFLNR